MKKFGQVVVTIEGVPTLNIPETMHDAGLLRFKKRKRVSKFINRKNKKIMATKKKIAKKAAAKKTVRRGLTDCEKMRNLYDMHVKKLGFTETQKMIIKRGYNRNTVVPVIWKHRIAIGEIDGPKKTVAKKTAKKSPAKKRPVAKKKLKNKSAAVVVAMGDAIPNTLAALAGQ